METPTPKRRFQFVSPDGELIELGNSNDTFVAFVEMVGPDKVEYLNLTTGDEPLILNEALSNWHKPLSNAKFLNTYQTPFSKISICNKICKALGLEGFYFSRTEIC